MIPFKPFTDAAPVRAHIRTLYAAGFTDYRIAQLTQTSPPTIHALGKRSYAKGRGQQHRIGQALAARILAITPGTAMPGRVPAAGTRRRLQALVAAGWPMLRVAQIAGMSPQNVSRFLHVPLVNAKTVQTITAVYEDLKNKRPERNGIDKISAKKARLRAQRLRWAPPAYWDHPDHLIDDGDFRSDYGVPRIEVIAEEARWLLGQGLTREQAAQRIGASRAYIDRALSQVPEPATEAAA